MIEALYRLWMTHISNVSKASRNLQLFHKNCLRYLGDLELSSEKLPKIEGLSLTCQLQAAGETLNANTIMDKLLKDLVYSYLTSHIGC